MLSVAGSLSAITMPQITPFLATATTVSGSIQSAVGSGQQTDIDESSAVFNLKFDVVSGS